ncbi:unnamed protein product [Albugo candida]|uniref:GOLD domain-containing protein n=1 Tax=Albugo candida TaxID=65357 RepID=A0A024GB92_9STRA|nr:unnamed protein product [Albugo candida]|eukprot:CCI43904.1 unnamed protein product [Albugo candida]
MNGRTVEREKDALVEASESDHHTATTSAGGFATEAGYSGRYSIIFEASGQCFAKSKMNALIVAFADVRKQIERSRQEVTEFRSNQSELLTCKNDQIVLEKNAYEATLLPLQAYHTISGIGFSHGLMIIFIAIRRANRYI